MIIQEERIKANEKDSIRFYRDGVGRRFTLLDLTEEEIIRYKNAISRYNNPIPENKRDNMN